MLYLNLDPFWFTFPKLFVFLFGTAGSVTEIITFLLRCLCGIICVAEGCRFVPLVLLLLILRLELQQSSLEVVDMIGQEITLNNNTSNSYIKFLKWYSTFQMSFDALKSPVADLVAVLMGDGFVLLVVCNLASLRCYNTLPLLVYWFMPTMSLLCTSVMYLLLQFTVETHNKSRELIIRVAKRFVGFQGAKVLGKILKRKLKLLQPITITCGSFYNLNREAPLEYYMHVAIQTSDGVLLPIW